MVESLCPQSYDSWDWPVGGIADQAQWSYTKWRLYLEDDLPTACLLELLGALAAGSAETIF